jgi:Ca2+-binding RTX toxin-like protein
VLLDLQPGHLSSVGISKDGFSSQENLGLAPGTWIENAVGSPSDDVLIGNSLNNRLQGLSGNDWLDGREGTDTVVFNVRRDQVLVSTAYGNVYVTSRDGSSGFDTLVNVEQLEFTDLVVKLKSSASGRDIEVAIDEDRSLEASLPDPTDQARSGVTYTKVTGPGHGTLTLSSTGQFSFLPTANYNGSDSFVFRIQDAAGNFNDYRYYIGVSAINDTPTGDLTIEGAATQGRMLKAVSSLADADGLGMLTYQWSANGAPIAGANSAQYLLGVSDVGKTFTVTASYTDLEGTFESVTTSATPKVLGGNAAPVGTVVISGVATEGQVLNATSSITDADGLGPITTRWQVSGDGLTGWADVVNSGGASNSSALTLKANQAGFYVRAAASYTDGLGLLETVFSAASRRIGALVNGASAGGVSMGTAGDDRFVGGPGDDRFEGGPGDDAYIVNDQSDLVIEFGAQGTDTVISSISYYLPPNVENLTLSGAAFFGVGNDLDNPMVGNTRDNILLGGAGNDTLDGGAGQDILWGQTGADTFLIRKGTGTDIIADFTPGTDRLDVRDYGFKTPAALMARMTQMGSDTTVDLGGGDSLLLIGIKATSLGPADLLVV